MKYSEKFAFFLEIPNAEQVRFAIRKKRLQDSCHFDSHFYSHASHMFIWTRKSRSSSTATCCLSLRCVFVGTFSVHLSVHVKNFVLNASDLFLPQMTRLVLPHMVERCEQKYQEQPIADGVQNQCIDACLLLPRGRGVIINISSEMGIHPQPLLSLYSATKVLSHARISIGPTLQITVTH